MTARGAQGDSLSIRKIEEQLLARWPETKLEPSLDRIAKVMALLGDPQRTYRSVHITGTNGKTSTARMVEALLAASGERTGRLTSPHLTSIRERIGIAEEVVGVPAFVSAYTAVAEQAELVDVTMRHPLSFFEMTVAMAYRAFDDAAVDVAVVEVGMGGQWDATNVIDADVAVVLPVDLDHTDYLGPTTATIAREKAGIIKPGAVAVSARQSEDVAEVLQARARSVGARLVVQGDDFCLLRRTAVGGGQVISVQGLYGTYGNVLLALHGRGGAGPEAGPGRGEGRSRPSRIAGSLRRTAGHSAGDPGCRTQSARGPRACPVPGRARAVPDVRRHRGDGGQERRGHAARTRARHRRCRLHPELEPSKPDAYAARCDRPAGVRTATNPRRLQRGDCDRKGSCARRTAARMRT